MLLQKGTIVKIVDADNCTTGWETNLSEDTEIKVGEKFTINLNANHEQSFIAKDIFAPFFVYAEEVEV